VKALGGKGLKKEMRCRGGDKGVKAEGKIGSLAVAKPGKTTRKRRKGKLYKNTKAGKGGRRGPCFEKETSEGTGDSQTAKKARTKNRRGSSSKKGESVEARGREKQMALKNGRTEKSKRVEKRSNPRNTPGKTEKQVEKHVKQYRGQKNSGYQVGPRRRETRTSGSCGLSTVVQRGDQHLAGRRKKRQDNFEKKKARR